MFSSLSADAVAERRGAMDHMMVALVPEHCWIDQVRQFLGLGILESNVKKVHVGEPGVAEEREPEQA